MFLQRKWIVALTALVLIYTSIGINRLLADSPLLFDKVALLPNQSAENIQLEQEKMGSLPISQANETAVDSEGNPTTPMNSVGQTEPVEEILSPADQDASTATYFKRYPGVAFQPRDSDTGYDYFGDGCISSKGADYFTVDLQLPADAEIDFIRMYYYDSSSANARMYLTWYDGQGGYSDVTQIDSSGSSGYGTVGGFTSYVVDPLNQSIVLVWRPNTTGSSMALCGARIRYQVPLGAAFMPSVMK